MIKHEETGIYINSKGITEFASMVCQIKNKNTVKDLEEICNKCKTERGLARAISNYIIKLKKKI